MWRRSLFLLLLGAGVAVDACGNSAFSSSDTDGEADASTDDGSSDGAGKDGAANEDGSIESDGSTPGTIVIVTGQDNPHDLLVQNGRIYWTNYSDAAGHGSVNVANIDGSDKHVVGVATHANRIAIDTSAIYWTDFVTPLSNTSIIASAPLDGGPPINIDESAVAPMGIAVDDHYLYVAQFFGIHSSGTIGYRDKATGATFGNIVSGIDNPVSVAVNATGVAWTQLGSTPSSGQVGFGSIDAGVIGIATSRPGPWGITMTNDKSYATELGAIDASTPGNIVATTLNSSADLTPVFAAGVRPYFIATDGTKLYWTEEGASIANGSVVWAKIGEFGSHVLASGQQRPHGIAVDASYVYWTSFSGGKIYRSPKP